MNGMKTCKVNDTEIALIKCLYFRCEDDGSEFTHVISCLPSEGEGQGSRLRVNPVQCAPDFRRNYAIGSESERRRSDNKRVLVGSVSD